jgi:polyisoprenoid-binding protein YceI
MRCFTPYSNRPPHRVSPMKLLALLSLALFLAAPLSLTFKSGSTVKVEGTSNVHGWSCETSQLAGTLEVDGAPASLAGLEGGRLTIPVQGLECGNGTMNRLMRDALKAGQAPQIQYAITSATVGAPDAQGRHTVTATGPLTIAGTTKTVQVRAQAVPAANGALRLTGSVPLTMTQFGVTPPTAMMGAMRTADAITVSFDVLVGR